MRVLDLFSGIGGFSLGLERAGMQTVAFCEIDPFCQAVLRKHWLDVPIYGDIRAINGRQLEHDGLTPIDLICGGFPCQPFSIAGRRKGKQDDRDLWPEMFRLIQELRPAWVLGENVANFTDMAFTRTKTDLESAGYQVQPLVIPACAVGAPHRRDRVWIIAHADHAGRAAPEDATDRNGKEKKSEWKRLPQPESGRYAEVAFAWYDGIQNFGQLFDRSNLPEPLVCRDHDGFPRRVDRLRSLGNAVVPQVVEVIGRGIIQRTGG